MKELKHYDILFKFKTLIGVKEFEECMPGYDKECAKETISVLYDVSEFISVEECRGLVKPSGSKPGYHK